MIPMKRMILSSSGLFLSMVCLVFITQTFMHNCRPSQSFKTGSISVIPSHMTEKDQSGAVKVRVQEHTGIFPFQMKKISQYTTLISSVYDDDRFLMNHLEPLNQIPPILHLSWKSDRVPEFAYNNFNIWNKTHSNWTILFWKDEDVHKYVHSVLKESKLYKTYSNFSKNIVKMDFSRYVILYTIGGVYADIDVTPLRQLEPILSHHTCIVAREPEAFPISIGMETTILASNFFMASVPGHPFWPFLMEKVMHRDGYPLAQAGPMAVTDSLRAFYDTQPLTSRSGAVFLAPSLYFDPPHGAKGEGDAIHITMLTARCRGWKPGRKIGSAFTNRICRILTQDRKIDFTAMYKHPKYFNDSFIRHGMFNSWNSNSASTVRYKNIDSLKFKLSKPSNLYKIGDGMGHTPYERDQKILDNEFNKT